MTEPQHQAERAQLSADIEAGALAKAEEYIEQEEGAANRLKGWLAVFVTLLAVAMSGWHLYSAYSIVQAQTLRATHLAFVLALCFLVFPVARRFRHRIMFPILDMRGRTIGFGGRILGTEKDPSGKSRGGGPKYLNSPETPIFHKGRELYGLYQALQHNRRPDNLLVVEGYMDVIALAQFGIRNAVATLGTACGEEHLKLAFRLTFLNKCDELERPTIAEFYQRAFGEDLPEAATRVKVG